MDKTRFEPTRAVGTCEHDDMEGLNADLERIVLGRRRLLRASAMGGLAAFTAACTSQPRNGTMASGQPSQLPHGFGPPPGGPGGHPPGPPPVVDNGPVVTGTSASGTQCLGYTRETQGPYPADGSNTARGSTSNVLNLTGIERTDIRSDIGLGSPVAGTVLDLTLHLVDVNDACAPLAGHAVYIWHCDAEGQYSLYDAPDHTWLRGLQVADANGTVKFRTVVPGCYMGRYPHIHFEVFRDRATAAAGKYARLTSQLAIPADVCDTVYSQSAYAGSRKIWQQFRNIETDNVFGDNGAERIAAMTLDIAGSRGPALSGSATVGLVT